jgi:hypothetical protein
MPPATHRDRHVVTHAFGAWDGVRDRHVMPRATHAAVAFIDPGAQASIGGPVGPVSHPGHPLRDPSAT